MFIWRRELSACAFWRTKHVRLQNFSAQITYFISFMCEPFGCHSLAAYFLTQFSLFLHCLKMRSQPDRAQNNQTCMNIICDLFVRVMFFFLHPHRASHSNRNLCEKFICSTLQTSVCRFGCAVFYRVFLFHLFSLFQVRLLDSFRLVVFSSSSSLFSFSFIFFLWILWFFLSKW